MPRGPSISKRARAGAFLGALLAVSGAGHASAQPRAASPAIAPGVEAALRAGEESPELRSLRLLEEELFGPAPRASATPPRVHGLELPPALTSDGPAEAPVVAEGGRDLAWLEGIALPDLPIRWDDRVVRYLELFRDDPRGRALMRAWYQRLGRHGAMIEGALERAGMPRDLRCVALAESGFDPTARSGAGAVGMWQFVEATGAEYGLERTHWVDERQDPLRSTAAAAAYLGHLHRRLGNWELTFAAYNMGYGALLRAIRKYNTNDYALLSRVEAGLPFETTVYVAKILACAVVLRNPERFGLSDVTQDAPITLRAVDVPGGVNLGTLARAAGMDRDALAALNPELLRGRTPPNAPRYDLRLPADRVDAFARAARRIRPGEEGQQAYVVRFGESLEDVADRYRTTVDALRATNEIRENERVGPGTALLVPAVAPREVRRSGEPPVVAVPDAPFRYEGRRRAFYRTSSGDTLAAIAEFFRVTVDELRTWNHLDPAAAVPAGLMIQLFVPTSVDLARAVVLTPDEVRILTVGSDEFFDYHERQRGRVRVRYDVREGDTLESIATRFGLEPADLSRINRIGRSELLAPGRALVVYCAPERAPRPATADGAATVAAETPPAVEAASSRAE